MRPFAKIFMPFCQPWQEQITHNIYPKYIKTMKKKVESLASYEKPEVKVIRLDVQSQLMDTSFPSQHHPAQPGGTISSAKQGSWFEDEEEEED